MDDTARLVADLLAKLSELDQKVCSYRQDMAYEFQRHSKCLLHNVPENVSAQVEEAIAGELANFPALAPALDLSRRPAHSQDVHDDRRGRQGRTSPPPVLPHTSGTPPLSNGDTTYKSHEREHEFTGLFTPSFLPLLDAAQPPKLVTVAPSTVLLCSTPQDEESNITQEPQHKSSTQRPTLPRRLTEESSVASDDSALQARRSALRRSSSASAKGTQSPRRVRFDFEGEEVLTTVSPPLSPRISDPLTSPPPDDIATPPPKALQGLVFGDDGQDSGLLGNSPPRPKKISSTDRLKAMARTSGEDTSKWTVVGEPMDDDDEEDGLVMPSSRRRPQMPIATHPLLESTHHEKETEDAMRIGRTGEDVRRLDDDKDANGDEEYDDSLEMVPLSSFKGKKRFSPSPEQQSKTESERSMSQSKSAGPQTTTSQPESYQSTQEEDMFAFEDENEQWTGSPTVAEAGKSKYIEHEEDEDDADNGGGDLPDAAPVTLYSTSPAVPISSTPTSRLPPPTSPISKQSGASAGSYKGKPFIIGVIRSDELHKKAAEMGDFSTFVGSVDGRSGVDASDSYRQDANVFNGTPRSLGERLMEMNSQRMANSPRRQE